MAHQGSRNHPKYTEQETNHVLGRLHEEIDGPITCGYIRSQGSSYCPAKHNCLGPGGYVTHPVDLTQWSGIRYTAGLDPLVQAYELIYRTAGTPVVCLNGQFLLYDGGHYSPIMDAELRHALMDQTGVNIKMKGLEDIEKALATITNKRPDDFERNKHLICCTNGTFDTNTLELLPHSPDHLLRSGLPIPYDPAAQCPGFLSFLHDIFRDDSDRGERLAFLQQWFGYLLIPTARLQLMLWLVGGGANGKSVLLEIMRQLVGPENCSTVMLDRLASGAVRAELDAKKLNISSDLPRNTAINDGYMKACIAGDAIDGERKFKPPFTFRPVAKFVASMNSMPNTNDLSHGFFRRIVVLQFNRRFTQAEQDQGLVSRLLEELPGILGWAVEGLGTLRQTWQLPIPPSSQAAVAHYAAESNPVGLFAEDCVEHSETNWIDASEVYEEFQCWCRASGFSPRSIVTFAREFAQLGFQKRKRNTRQWGVHITRTHISRFS